MWVFSASEPINTWNSVSHDRFESLRAGSMVTSPFIVYSSVLLCYKALVLALKRLIAGRST